MARAGSRRPTSAARRAASVQRAYGRRADASARRTVRIDWYIDQVSLYMNLGLKHRVQIATEHLRNRVVENISKPVTKAVGPNGGVQVTQRSRPGEFPRADTTLLMKTIFGEVMESRPRVWEGYVGTPLDYGLILEVSPRLDRSFLLRTFREESERIRKILTAPFEGHTVEVIT